MNPGHDPIPLPTSLDGLARIQASLHLRQHHAVLPLIAETAGADDFRIWQLAAFGGSVRVRLQSTADEDGGRLCLALTPGTDGTVPAVRYGQGGSFGRATRLTISACADCDGASTTREMLLRWGSGDFAANPDPIVQFKRDSEKNSRQPFLP